MKMMIINKKFVIFTKISFFVLIWLFKNIYNKNSSLFFFFCLCVRVFVCVCVCFLDKKELGNGFIFEIPVKNIT